MKESIQCLFRGESAYLLVEYILDSTWIDRNPFSAVHILTHETPNEVPQVVYCHHIRDNSGVLGG